MNQRISGDIDLRKYCSVIFYQSNTLQNEFRTQRGKQLNRPMRSHSPGPLLTAARVGVRGFARLASPGK